jgi:hypothetical protein
MFTRELLEQCERERQAFREELQRVDPNWYMVHVNSGGAVFVKELDFFHEQGGFAKPWGQHWTPVVANNIEDARRRGCETLPGARPYEWQAKP